MNGKQIQYSVPVQFVPFYGRAQKVDNTHYWHILQQKKIQIAQFAFCHVSF